MEGSTSKRGKQLQIGLAEEACEGCKLHANFAWTQNSECLAQDYEYERLAQDYKRLAQDYERLAQDYERLAQDYKRLAQDFEQTWAGLS